MKIFQRNEFFTAIRKEQKQVVNVRSTRAQYILGFITCISILTSKLKSGDPTAQIPLCVCPQRNLRPEMLDQHYQCGSRDSRLAPDIFLFPKIPGTPSFDPHNCCRQQFVDCIKPNMKCHFLILNLLFLVNSVII